MDTKSRTLILACFAALSVPAAQSATSNYRIYISNERSGDVTVINGSDHKVLNTFPVGKRPRGLHAGPDRRKLFVAVSGSPITGPPKLDAQGRPIKVDADDLPEADKSADGIAVLDLASGKLDQKISCGSDPEEFAVSPDGKRLYVSNEDVATASVVNIETGKVEDIVKVGEEPEGVVFTPNGKFVYVTCEEKGEVYVIGTADNKTAATLNLGGRPRTAAFLADSSIAFVPSETTAEINVIDAVKNEPLKKIKLPAGMRPMCVIMAPDGKKLYVSTGRGGTVAVIDTKTYEILNNIKVGARPFGIRISPDGKYLYSANGPSDDVSLVDLGTEKEIARIPAGKSPWGVAIVQEPQ
jgi:YVTN family beta-propeller protein